MKLILIGGVRGSGADTLFRQLRQSNGTEATFLDLTARNLQVRDENREAAIFSALRAHADESVLVCHWDYAIPNFNDYVPAVSLKVFEQIIAELRPEILYTVIVRATPPAIVENRMRDSFRSGPPSMRSVLEELIEVKDYALMNREVAKLHCPAEAHSVSAMQIVRAQADLSQFITVLSGASRVSV